MTLTELQAVPEGTRVGLHMRRFLELPATNIGTLKEGRIVWDDGAESSPIKCWTAELADSVSVIEGKE